MTRLARYAEPAYALVRLVAGFLFAFHGVQKMFGILGGYQPPFFTQIWFGGLIELVGGFLIMIGWRTREAAFLSSGTMAVAYVQFHWKGQLGAPLFPAINKGELALLYAVLFLYLACRGTGRWGVDRPDATKEISET